MTKSFTLTFCGGAGEVTGANFLLEGRDVKILVDCGLTQGSRFCNDCNREPFPYDPASIDFLFITHAHMDHIGRVPLLVKRGFSGVIYATPATKELAAVMLEDSLGIMEKEARRDGKEPLYGAADVKAALSLWKDIPYHAPTSFAEGLTVVFKDAGHILGSAIIELSREKKIAFTGDLGNSPAPLLRDTEPVVDADYMVMESVYGDRNHEDVGARTKRLREVICETIGKSGVLLVPAFSIERTQVLLHEIKQLIADKKIDDVPVFLDSPLAIAVTDIYREHASNFNCSVQENSAHSGELFDFPGLAFTRTSEASKAINYVDPPKVIIAGAGMSHGGRIQHHEARYLSDPTTTLLLVGFQVPGSLGRKLQDGLSEVRIHDKSVKVNASVETIRGYSAHKDSDGLIDFVSRGKDSFEKVFVAMGEPKASLFLVQRLRDFLDVDAIAPAQGERYEIEL